MRAYWYVEVLYRSMRRFIGPFADLDRATEYQGSARRAIFGLRSGIMIGPIRAVTLKGEEFPGMLNMTAEIPEDPQVAALAALFGGGDEVLGDLGSGSSSSGGTGDLGSA